MKKKIKKWMCCCFTCVEVEEHDDGYSSDGSEALRVGLLGAEQDMGANYHTVFPVIRENVLDEKARLMQGRSLRYGSRTSISLIDNDSDSNDDNDSVFMYTNKYFAPGRTLEDLKEEQRRLNVKYFNNRHISCYKNTRIMPRNRIRKQFRPVISRSTSEISLKNDIL